MSHVGPTREVRVNSSSWLSVGVGLPPTTVSLAMLGTRERSSCVWAYGMRVCYVNHSATAGTGVVLLPFATRRRTLVSHQTTNPRGLVAALCFVKRGEGG